MDASPRKRCGRSRNKMDRRRSRDRGSQEDSDGSDLGPREETEEGDEERQKARDAFTEGMLNGTWSDSSESLRELQAEQAQAVGGCVQGDPAPLARG